MLNRWLVGVGIAVAVTLFCPTFTLPVYAADQPLLSLNRASLAAGVDYAGYQQQGVQKLPDFKKAFEVGLYGAYVLTPHVTATVSGAYDVDNKFIRWRAGVRTVLWRGKD